MPLKSTTLQVALLLLVAVLFGGGGSGAGLANLAVQLCALLVLVLNPQAVIGFFQRSPKAAAMLVGFSLAMPLLQSIPLPPVVWHGLPGRSPAEEAFALLGSGDAWMPFSLEWHRTLIAFFAMLPPFTVLVLVWDMPEGEQRRLLLFVVVLGVFMVVLGAYQLLGGNQSLMFFNEARGSRYLVATFAGHSATGLYLVLALCAMIATVPRNSDPKLLLATAAVALLLMTGLILGRSRAALVLTIIPLLLVIFRFANTSKSVSRGRATFSARLALAVFVAGATIVGGGSMLVKRNDLIQKSVIRFEHINDIRPLIWRDSVDALDHYWPVGSGIGTFDEIFQLHETLENLTPARAARAHNDLLEVGIESGALGFALLCLWLAFLSVRTIQAAQFGGLAQAAAAGLVAVALHSILDFPLRNQTLLCVAGLFLAILIRAPRGRRISNLSEDVL